MNFEFSVRPDLEKCGNLKLYQTTPIVRGYININNENYFFNKTIQISEIKKIS